MDLNEILELVEKHIESSNALMITSALICLYDAKDGNRHGEIDYAKSRALKALKYLVGISHPNYLLAAKD